MFLKINVALLAHQYLYMFEVWTPLHRSPPGERQKDGGWHSAMSWLAIFITTNLYTAQPWCFCVMTALMVAPICTVVDLFS